MTESFVFLSLHVLCTVLGRVDDIEARLSGGSLFSTPLDAASRWLPRVRHQEQLAVSQLELIFPS